MINWRIAFLIFLPLTILVFSQKDWACCCGGHPSPYQAYRENATIFVGTAVSEQSDTEYEKDSDSSFRETFSIFTFETEETFKGPPADSVDIRAYGGSGGSCGYRFEIGKQYIIFASLDKDKILISTICDRTRPIEEAQDDLEILHKIRSGIAETRAFGVVSRWRGNFSGGYASEEYLGGLAGAVVTAKSKTETFETVTDAQGRFRFINLPLGKYSVEPTTMNGKNKWGPETIEVTTANGGGELQFYMSIDANITGHVFDFEGKPTFAHISLVSIETKDGRISLKDKQIVSPKEGIYEFEAVPPGQYVIGVSILDTPTIRSPYSKTFYPYTPDLDKATIINVEGGEQLTYDLSLLQPLPLRTFKGTVIRADGKLRERVSVQVIDMDDPTNSSYNSEVNIDDLGRFEIKGFADRRYWLHAYEVFYSDPMHSDLVPAPTDGDTAPIKLVMVKPGYQPDLKRPKDN